MTPGMTQLEKEYIMQLINQQYGKRAALGNGLDMAGTALGFVDDAVSPAATKLQDFIAGNVAKIDPKMPTSILGVPTEKGKVVAMLSGPQAKMLSKAAVGAGALGAVLGAGDIVLGQDSAANKGMDTLFGTVGGVLGSAGGPLGAAAGFGTGKAISDGIQFIVGGGKSQEERAREEALSLLRDMA